jgi:2-polyprenyl-3-methyl-5-hydroxy-6-metoxy-1,4-benzoquinol methylase
MENDPNYIYEEHQWRSIERPFTIQHCKVCRSFKKRFTALRRLVFQPRGRMRERIVEYPLAIAAMAKLPRDSRVADLGGASSLLGLYLTSLGHEVHVLDLRPSPLQHPKLHVQQIDAFDNDLPDDHFDGISCISVIEHVGIVRYGGQERIDGDRAMLKEMQRLCKAGGLIVLSAPYGKGHDPETEGPPSGYRIYDRDRLAKLIEDFEVEALQFFAMENGVWVEKDQQAADQAPTSRPIDAIFFAQLRTKK